MTARAGLEDSDDEAREPGGEMEAEGQRKEGLGVEPGDKQTVEKPKERASIFEAFMASDTGLVVTEQPTPSVQNTHGVMGEGKTAEATAQAKQSAPRKYGQAGLVAMLRKDGASGLTGSATLLPETLQGPAKASVEWREPVLGESDDDFEGDDEADDDEEDEADEEEDDEDEEGDEDEEEDEDEKPAKKKSLNDVQSIKKNTLRLGTLDAGYLR